MVCYKRCCKECRVITCVVTHVILPPGVENPLFNLDEFSLDKKPGPLGVEDDNDTLSAMDISSLSLSLLLPVGDWGCQSLAARRFLGVSLPLTGGPAPAMAAAARLVERMLLWVLRWWG